jgi:hypothetical protein
MTHYASGRYYTTTVFSETSSRNGLGWELEDIAPAPGRGQLMEIFRDDSEAVPIINCRTFGPVPAEIVDRFAREAVADLLHDVLNRRRTNWLANNIAQALALAGRTVLRWSGPEWSLVDADDPRDNEFVPPDADRLPFHCLQAHLADGGAEISIYQDDTWFGLCFEPEMARELEEYTADHFRLHREADLPTGLIERVEAVLDDSMRTEGWDDDVVLTEVALDVGGRSMLLMAAEPYDGDQEWHLYDEMVVVLRDPSAADRLEWAEPRPTHGRFSRKA